MHGVNRQALQMTQSYAPGNLKGSKDGRLHQVSTKIHSVFVRSQSRSKSVDDILAAHWTFGVWLAEQIGILHFDICTDRLYK